MSYRLQQRGSTVLMPSQKFHHKSSQKAPQLRLLCLGTYPVESAATRYRVLQFFPALRAEGIEPHFLPFMDSVFFRGFYQPRHRVRKALRLMGFALRRVAQLSQAQDFDAVLIHREAALFGPPLIERYLSRIARKPLIFDFDDAIQLPFKSPVYGSIATLLKNPKKTPQIIGMSQSVIAGNRHLENYARTLNSRVCVIPTVVDANILRPAPQLRSERLSRGEPIVLGWMGTHSTLPYLEALFPTLQRLAQSHSIVLRVVGAGREVQIAGVEVDNRRWSLQNEVSDLQSFDIGLYPILEDEWSLGKSGFKAVQYMATATPVVASPVGATCDIVRDGVDGFLPTSPAQWLERLAQLIKDASLRQTLGAAGRDRFESWYCLQKQAPRLIEVVREAVNTPSFH